LPVIASCNPDRKDRASWDFRYFCESYFPLTFHLAWSPDHLKVISKIENAVIHGGLFALAMARATGKSSLVEGACIWSVLYGHRDFVCLIGSDEGHACDMLDSIKTELDSNDQLLADFPEVCFPIQALDGISNVWSGTSSANSTTSPRSRRSTAVTLAATPTLCPYGVKYLTIWEHSAPEAWLSS